MADDRDERKVVRIDPELGALVPGYLENRRRDATSILRAQEQGDYETIQRLAHSMRGSGGGYGFDTITEIGNSLEQAAKNRDSEGVKKCSSALRAYLECVEVIYE